MCYLLLFKILLEGSQGFCEGGSITGKVIELSNTMTNEILKVVKALFEEESGVFSAGALYFLGSRSWPCSLGTRTNQSLALDRRVGLVLVDDIAWCRVRPGCVE